MFRVLPNTVQIAHEYLRRAVSPGGVAIDATVGNGRDTVFLAELVGPEGHVYGFDIQERAIETALERVAEKGFSGIVTLFCTGHENMSEYITNPVDAVVFNLGYLPGGDHNVVTKPETTVKALEQSVSLLKSGGLICIVIYTGHKGGQEEGYHLEDYLAKLDKKEFCVGRLDFLNRKQAPYIILVEKNHNQEGFCEISSSQKNNRID